MNVSEHFEGTEGGGNIDTEDASDAYAGNLDTSKAEGTFVFTSPHLGAN